MIEGITHTPTQADSHEALQARQGWSVASMREEIDALKKELYESRDFWSRSNHDLLEQLQITQRQLNGFQARVRNALNYLELVNCGNVDRAKIECAKLELLDIDRRRGEQ